MKYETPELTALPSAINAVQSATPGKPHQVSGDGSPNNESVGAYEDWE